LIEKKGIKPIQLASRAYLGALLRSKPPEQKIKLTTKEVLQNEELQNLMSLTFHRARDKISNLKSKESSAEHKFSRFYLNDTLHDEEIISILWSLLNEEKDLDNISTKDIRDKLEKALNIELKEKKEFVNNQIEKIVGQMVI
jgi:hypothetical protein